MAPARRRQTRVNEGNVDATLKGLVLGPDGDMRYAVTVDGLFALYRSLYSKDIDHLENFMRYITGGGGNDTVFDYIEDFVWDLISEDSSDAEIVDSVESGEFANHMLPNGRMFDNMDNSECGEWAAGVRVILGM